MIRISLNGPKQLELDIPSLSGSEQKLLRAIAKNPEAKTRDYFVFAHISAGAGNAAKKSLIKQGLIKEVAVRKPGRGHSFRTMSITEAGETLLGGIS